YRQTSPSPGGTDQLFTLRLIFTCVRIAFGHVLLVAGPLGAGAMADEDRIIGRTSNVRQLFTGRRYTIDSYQREYSWETKHVEDLIQDLSQRFLPAWDALPERRDVRYYPSYFLGPIIVTADERINLIDGQQRL